MSWKTEWKSVNVFWCWFVFLFHGRDQKSPKSPQNFSYGSKVSDAQYFHLEEPPRSPKITYSTPSPTSNKMASVTDNSGIMSPSTGYFEQRSPKYVQHQTSPRKFVFDAVSPRRESIGKLLTIKANEHNFLSIWLATWQQMHKDRTTRACRDSSIFSIGRERKMFISFLGISMYDLIQIL